MMKLNTVKKKLRRFAFLVLFVASANVNIGQLEQQLILSLDARQIRQILIELHGMAERAFWRVNSKVRSMRVKKLVS